MKYIIKFFLYIYMVMVKMKYTCLNSWFKNTRDRKWRIPSPISHAESVFPYRNTAYITVDVTNTDLKNYILI